MLPFIAIARLSICIQIEIMFSIRLQPKDFKEMGRDGQEMISFNLLTMTWF